VSGPVPGWLMSMGYRSTLAGVVAAVLFAVTWPICDQLAPDAMLTCSGTKRRLRMLTDPEAQS
jgi:hypothetical protein